MRVSRPLRGNGSSIFPIRTRMRYYNNAWVTKEGHTCVHIEIYVAENTDFRATAVNTYRRSIIFLCTLRVLSSTRIFSVSFRSVSCWGDGRPFGFFGVFQLRTRGSYYLCLQKRPYGSCIPKMRNHKYDANLVLGYLFFWEWFIHCARVLYRTRYERGGRHRRWGNARRSGVETSAIIISYVQERKKERNEMK